MLAERAAFEGSGWSDQVPFLLAERTRCYRERLTTAMSPAAAEAASAPTTMSSRPAEVLRTYL